MFFFIVFCRFFLKQYVLVMKNSKYALQKVSKTSHIVCLKRSIFEINEIQVESSVIFFALELSCEHKNKKTLEPPGDKSVTGREK